MEHHASNNLGTQAATLLGLTALEQGTYVNHFHCAPAAAPVVPRFIRRLLGGAKKEAGNYDATPGGPNKHGQGDKEPPRTSRGKPAHLDDSIAKYARPAEQRTAERLATGHPEFDGLTFKAPPPPDPGHDWYDNMGRKYDAMGDGTKAEFQNMNDFKRSIDSHLRKGNDFTVIDMTGYKPEQIVDVKNYVDSLPLDKQATIRRIGF